MTVLSAWYRDGTHGLTTNSASCFQWAKRAADLDDPTGMTMLGECYLNGYGSARNSHTALVKLAQAAMLGSEHACFRLAHVYSGEFHAVMGVEQDDTQMAYWQEKMKSLAGNGKCETTEEIRELVASLRPGGLTAE